MNLRLSPLTHAIRHGLSASRAALGRLAGGTGRVVLASRRGLWVAGVLGLTTWALVTHAPLRTVARGDIGVRTNQFTGSTTEFSAGSVIVLPGLHELRTYPLRDQVFRPAQGRKADGEAPFQSVEGLSLGVDLSIRYALDPARIAAMSKKLPDDIAGEVVQPAVQGVVYKAFTRYTVREIFSSKRAEIQQAVEAELRTKLAADGILLRSVQMGQVDLPAEYRQGMDKLLVEELASEKMRYTLELKEKRVKETELEAQADKVRRETAAAAAANEQVIAARAQEEAMKHVLPFKQKQIEQRQFEAEAEKVARIKSAEASAQARRIEAAGEAESRQKLADAEAYRLDRVGKIASEQMARDGALITRHPLLIQKTVADKLSDKIQVIIAPPSTDGRFIAAGLIGASQPQAPAEVAQVQEGE
ncbi:SPFH domain-containing protein [Caldimonas brevitalea]|uniref:Spfh domain / band 7 family protein n=1 Tax=Caldimonas brevitalea TaxID=413882 RepID=A0A0G3BUD4_9BURK|nr:SPFH domain-containing protein [Caldimonas brevitalea]AKJ31633.1 spfh domain / band 7 family protein [Caldimonas brevitalea]